MKRLAWLTDTHLNFCTKEERQLFYKEIVNSKIDFVAISGDISEATDVKEKVREIAHAVKKPIFFVLGNHDYYCGNVNTVRQEMRDLTTLYFDKVYWLPECDKQNHLSKNTIILGTDGWADGRYGNFNKSWVKLNDQNYIYDLKVSARLGRQVLLKQMQYLADQDAERLGVQLNWDTKEFKKIIVVTHIPPFKQACFYRGVQSDDDFLPFYSSKATGDVLKKFAKKHPDKEILVLCGHTHGQSTYKPLKNLTVETGGAEYHHPKIQKIIEV